jgi:hypothetical protein
MKTRTPIFAFTWFLAFLLSLSCAASESVPLAGDWRFALDASDVGINAQWFNSNLVNHIRLPGALQSQGYGSEISITTPWVLSLYDRNWFLRADYQAYTNTGNVKVPFVCQPPRHFLGAAWYQRDIQIPGSWQSRRVVLFLERPHWETRVWLDDKLIGTNDSLCVPHEFDLGVVSPGPHRLSIRVDNRLIMNYRPDSHSVSDSLDGSWNGIVGKIELRSTPQVWIEEARVIPDIAKKSVKISVRIGNSSGQPGAGVISAGRASAPVSWTADGATAELEVSLGPDAQFWDEFHPVLQHLDLHLAADAITDDRQLTFGLSAFKADGQDFVLNGRKVYLRGTHDGGDFPITGYPPTDVDSWRKLFQTCQEWGLNLMRFHSWCPPEAAFEAADELGFFLQPECGMWNELSPGTPMEAMLYKETDRIIKAYGNHPSFVLLSPSNEPHGRFKESLPKWVEYCRKNDARRLYTTGTGWSLIDSPGPVHGADYLAVGRIGMNPLRGQSAWFGRDYSHSLTGVDVPVVSHELGQWCAYPDYDIIRKFSGYMRPGNYEIFRDSLASHGMAGRDKDFAYASGRFQLACYKEEIEANLRTPGLSGFELLDLHDYVGQGTALVGLLDTFWQTKGYVDAAEFRQFCNATVPLARLRNRVFTTSDPFNIDVEIAHYDAEPLKDAAAFWTVAEADGRVAAHGEWQPKDIPIGKNIPLGKVSVDLSRLAAPRQYQLAVGLRNTAVKNTWAFWLYPTNTLGLAPGSAGVSPPVEPPDVLVTSSWAEAERRLDAGGKVLFQPRTADLDWTCPPLENLPIFWNRLMNPGWARMLGLWCDAKHPALAEFPTEASGDWQWMQLVRGARGFNLGHFPMDLQPIVQVIDDWNRNWKLGAIFECRVGQGRLIVSVFDLTNNLADHPVARQLRRSLLDYMASDRFKPAVAVSAEDFQRVLFDTRIMRRLGATATADGGEATSAIDGDPNTYWSVGGIGRGMSGTKHPHELTVRFPQPVAMNGLVLMPRQNDRDHLGDTREYVVETSDDGQGWKEVFHGQLASTWDPQRVQFPQTVTTRQLRFTSLSGFGSDTSAALAEIAVIYAGPKLPDQDTGTIEYRRSRSTSTDVDEGAVSPPRTNDTPAKP